LDSRVYVAGHRGLVGGAVWRSLLTKGFTNLIGWSSKELDLCDRTSTLEAVAGAKPDVIIMAAAKVGGIGANNDFPVEFLTDNIRIQANVFEAANKANVDRLMFLGSSCIYPKFAEQPIREDSLLTGPLEPTNDAYAIAKIAGVLHVQGYRREYDRNWFSVMPTNLYGPGDNFDLETSHVLPAMIRKFHDAKISGSEEVVLWGDGSPLREFLHVDDLANACIYLLESYNGKEPINVGYGTDISIMALASMIAERVGFQGKVVWDASKPNGTPRKLLDSSRIRSLGWSPKFSLMEGIKDTYDWYVNATRESNSHA
jgi:GDP-L-fucose synthase